MSKVNEIVKRLELQSHPEGGYYKELYRSADMVLLPDRFNNEERASATAIYYLLESGDFSAWHRIKSDEMWLFHSGGTLSIYVIQPDGELVTYRLGDQIANDDAWFQVAIKAGLWFAAEVNDPDSYVLASCYVAPGFEFKDFELAKKDTLLAEYPQHKQIIERLVR